MDGITTLYSTLNNGSEAAVFERSNRQMTGNDTGVNKPALSAWRAS